MSCVFFFGNPKAKRAPKTKKKYKKLRNPKCRRKWKKKNEYYFCTLLRSEKRERERRKNARVREREREESAIAPSVFAFCLSLVYISECFTKRERDSHIYPTSDFWGIISLPNQRERIKYLLNRDDDDDDDDNCGRSL